MGYGVFENCDAKKCTVYVPKGTYDDYWLSDFGYFFENIVEFDATGIDKTTTSTDVEEVSRYSVNGQRLVGPTKGLNILKYSDGSVKKVAVEYDESILIIFGARPIVPLFVSNLSYFLTFLSFIAPKVCFSRDL